MNYKTKSQQYINFYFQVHQPKRLRRFQFFDIGSSSTYFDESSNKEIITRIAANCYLPANEMLLALIKKYPNIRITFSLSGIVIEQLKAYSPETLESFKRLAETGAVEFLGETYYHSLAYFLDKTEFSSQVEAHRDAIVENFNCVPKVFRNTELIYSNGIADTVSDLGFKGIYLDGIEKILKGRSCNKIYSDPSGKILLLPRNYRLSDDIAFRYSDTSWSEWPLSAETLLTWIKHIPDGNNFTSIGMDYETLGEHQKSAGGIFVFMETLLKKLVRQKQFILINPSEAIDRIAPEGIISSEKPISWADQEKDLSAWLGNEMQRDAFASLKKLLPTVNRMGNPKLVREYRYLQTSDHFYYMSTKKGSDGNVHQYFSPYNSPYEAFMNYMNVLADMEYRLKGRCLEVPAENELAYL